MAATGATPIGNVLMDGREVYSPSFGGVYREVRDAPPCDIDRIEQLDRNARRGNAWQLEGSAYSGSLGQSLVLPSPQAPCTVLYPDRAAVSGFNLLGRWKTATSLTSEFSLEGFYDHTYRREIFPTGERDTLDLNFQHRFQLSVVGQNLLRRRHLEYEQETLGSIAQLRAAPRLFSARLVVLTGDGMLSKQDLRKMAAAPPFALRSALGGVEESARTARRASPGKFARHLSIRPGWLARLALALLLSAAGSRAFGLDEDAMKGAYLYSLVKFVDWPAPLSLGDNQIHVCVLGEERLKALASALQQKPVHGRSISVVSLARREAKSCQVVYVAASESWRLQSLLSELAERPTLTVGETDHFASRGGMIEFVLDDHRLGFEINNAAAQRAGLHISAQLLRLAKSVHK